MAMDGMMSTSSGLSYHNVGDFYPRKFGPKPDVVPSGVTERKVGPLDKPDMVSVDVINIKDSDVPLHRKKLEHDSYVLGTIHPFRRTHRSIFGKLQQEFRLVASDRRSWRILLFGSLNLLCTGCLLMWCSSTNSMVVHTDVRCVYGQCGSCLPPTLNPLRDLIAQEEEQHATLDPANTAASHTHTHTTGVASGVVQTGSAGQRYRTHGGKATPPSILAPDESRADRGRVSILSVRVLIRAHAHF
ncbi:hypothetical protein INR49_011936 [Caranx melampygus]|nr:hypothetical protein INR49_011936 [Caranx melampygus]